MGFFDMKSSIFDSSDDNDKISSQLKDIQNDNYIDPKFAVSIGDYLIDKRKVKTVDRYDLYMCIKNEKYKTAGFFESIFTSEYIDKEFDVLKIVTTDSKHNANVVSGIGKVTILPKSKLGQKQYYADARVKNLGNIPGTGVIFVCHDKNIPSYVEDIFETRTRVSQTINTNKNQYESASCNFWLCWGGAIFIHTDESYEQIINEFKRK